METIKNLNFRNLLLMTVVAILFSGCSYTKLTSSWFDKDKPAKHYKKIGVVVLAPEKSNRSLMENSIVTALKAKQINAVNTLGVFPRAGNLGDIEIDEEELRATVHKKLTVRKIDALLLVTLLDVKEDQYYVEGDVKTYPEVYYGGHGLAYAYNVQHYSSYHYTMYGYYYNYSTMIEEEGYYANTTSYFLETSLFDMRSEKLIWAAQTTTTDPTSISKEIKTYAGLIADRILHDGVIKIN